MKQFEEQLKDAFDGFEPEVDPSVWTNVSNAISSPAPVAGAASGSAITGFSAVTGWIAAAITIAAGALIYHFVSPSTSTTTKDSQPATSVSAPVSESTLPQSAIAPKGNTNAATVKSETSASSLENYFESTSVPAPVISSENHKIVNSDAQAESVATTELTKHENPAPIKNTVKVESVISTSPIAVKNTESQIENSVSPVLIASSYCGFAPLVVTFMLNNNLKTDINFGDGNVAFKTNSVTHKFENSGRYMIACEVNGKQLTTEVEVLGQLGTAFSPNGDGINDVFNFGGNEVDKVEVRVYNRFGKTIFTGSGNNPGWDGNYSDGSKAESGTYFYDIFATSVGGTDFKQKGTINLFR